MELRSAGQVRFDFLLAAKGCCTFSLDPDIAPLWRDLRYAPTSLIGAGFKRTPDGIGISATIE